MQNSQLIGLSAQMALSRELEVIANNMANVTTTGFKARNTRFQEYLMPKASAESFQRPDRKLSYVIDAATPLDLAQGPVETTGNPLNVAVRGEAFLAVQTPQGERYTRNGAFEMNPQGQIVTSDGHPVLGDGGPIQIGQQETGLTIGPDGTVSTNQGTRGKIRLVTFADPQGLTNAGANLYASNAPPQAAGPQARVVPGALERSNVQPVLAMTRMLEVSRVYQLVSDTVSRLDSLRGTAIQRLADVGNA
ncbi:flagellar basal-body rod protein FlgF [Methylobacterium nonmethylotrophicum]|uniref:Flagellar basal-body rod protein FlgF n=1 Tax=Methylobacterium nonmethylotrophicum TaxID=1141884 RepID=A0A4Z0NR01_9HYPH|nr:flagellar basal-body rod protein FlgF [Methylobacterium nonmethylotrophicum]TGD98955.1 flagellar basal-body rod protein FlgF [Methylobacterium nonmethylotrophicum]